jgi:hypothetical protein
MNRSGVLGDFYWVEIRTHHSDIPAVVRCLAAEVIGLTAVNVSWDSGHMIPTPQQEQIGWRRLGELAVSPVVVSATKSADRRIRRGLRSRQSKRESHDE